MKFLPIILLSMLLVASCQSEKTYTIEGAIYGGGNFEGETIYLVPFLNAQSENVDSATIRNGRFSFSGTMEKNDIYILRMRPMMRLFIQELIVIKEPGTVHTYLNKVSRAQGTPLNDSMQRWRDYKLRNDSILTSLRREIIRSGADKREALEARFDSIKESFDKYNRAIVERNSNEFGKFIDKFTK